MNAIDFVVRTRTGAVERGSVGGENQGFLINAGAGNDISLNISQADLRGYDRAADDLLITLSDGRVIVLEGYFETGAEAGNRLFLSADGVLNEVSFVENDGGALFAQYGPTETWGKWSPSDELIFFDDPKVVADAYVGDDDEVSMLGAGLGLLGAGGLGTAAGVGAASLAGAALIGLGGGGGSGGGGGGTGNEGETWTPPTVDNPDAVLEIGGDDEASIPISGTANPGSIIEVVIGDETVTGESGEDGIWEVIFEGDDFPEDGSYEDIDVTVTDPDGTVTELDGPTAIIDTTPPALDVSEGTVGAGDLFNAISYDDGVSISGEAEVGSTVVVTLGEHSQTVTVGEDGSWSFSFDQTVLPGGEYLTDVTITATDSFGNTTTVTDSIEIDTIPHPLVIDPVGADNLVNGAEAAAGFEITGTSTAGATVTVSFGSITQDVVVGADGTWSLAVSQSDFEGGEYTGTITATTVDAAGNPSSTTSEVLIDTVPHPLTIDPVGADNLVNGAEAEAGFEITGTSTAGATVTVSFGTITQNVVVAADGTWSLAVTAADFEGGEYTGTITATTVDAAGNPSSTTSEVQIDTVSALSLTNTPLTGDDLINAAEHNAGVTLTGTTQPGSSVEVTIDGVTQSATVSASGSWSVTYSASQLAAGTYTTTAMIVATDASGNVSTTSHDFAVDTEMSLTLNTSGVETDGIVNAAERADGVQLTGTGEAGAAVEVTVAGYVTNTVVQANGSWVVTVPAAAIPEGERSLQVSAVSTDAAGNRATANGAIEIDTQTNVTVNTAGVEGDGVVNAAEHADGVILTGTTEPGSTVEVTLGAVTRTATVSANGSWSVEFSAASIPTGERTLDVRADSTDAAGNTATASGTLDVDTFVRNFATTSTPGGADGIINAEEAAQGLTLTGTTEVGGAVMITLGTVTVPAVVDAEGNWTANFSAAQLPSGERTLTMTAVSTDQAGNSETLTQSVRIDTDAGILTISPVPVEGDDVVNYDEASDGVVLTGTSNPGQMVLVTMNGVSHTVQTNAEGIWYAPFAAHEVAPGTYTAEITADITDSAGNTLHRTDSVRVDTEVLNFGISDTPITADNVINAAERGRGVTLSGTTEPGGSVEIVIDNVSHTADVDSNGNWSIRLGSGQLPTGETTLPVLVQTEDAVGNTAEASVTLTIDTVVNVLTMSDAPLTVDNVINAEEALQGFTLNGQVEAGSTVEVTFGGVVHVAAVAGDGSWTVDIPPSSIPEASGDLPVVIEATDAAGNTRSITEAVSVDTEVPETLGWLGYGRNGGGVDEIRTEVTQDTVFIGQLVDGSGGPEIVDVAIDNVFTVPTSPPVTYHTFNGTVADGTSLVLATSDLAGNTSGALLVTDDPASNEVMITDDIAAALSEFQIDTIDLHFAEDSHLTITEAQITALSSTTDTVSIVGGSDDSVTILGAQSAGSVNQGGNNYNAFSLGDATILIDDDITNVNTGVV